MYATHFGLNGGQSKKYVTTMEVHSDYCSTIDFTTFIMIYFTAFDSTNNNMRAGYNLII